MKVIRRSILSIKRTDREIIMLPNEAEIFYVGLQDGKIAIWAYIDTEAPEAKAYFEVLLDEQELPEGLFEDLIYLGSTHLDHSTQHVFLRKP